MNIDSSKLNNYQEYEIDLGVLLRSLNQNKKFIAIFTFIFGLLAFLYNASLPEIKPNYVSRIYFLAPSELNVKKINAMLTDKVTQKSLYNKFLTKALSVDFQKKIFQIKNYSKLIEDEYQAESTFINLGDEFLSQIKTLDSEILAVSKIGSYEVPWTISLTGADPILITNFLNDLAKNADMEVIKELKEISEFDTNKRLNEIFIEKDQLKKVKSPSIEIINRILNLEIEEEKLRSIVIDFNNLNSVQIDQEAVPPANPIKIKQRKRSIILIFQIFGGFLLSIFIVYIRNIYKLDRNIAN